MTDVLGPADGLTQSERPALNDTVTQPAVRIFDASSEHRVKPIGRRWVGGMVFIIRDFGVLRFRWNARG